LLIESVPNFSGRPEPILAALAGNILLDHSFDPDHNRSVLTLAGPPAAILDAVLQAAAAAVAHIDLRQHHGVHPRIGALDVLPFIPLEGTTMQDCVRLAHRAGQRLWDELRVPVYFYEHAARRDACHNLSGLRRRALTLPPDIGGPEHHPTAGATAVGARQFLIAFNVNLASDDLGAAKAIAETIRESSGGLPGVKALGLPLQSRGIVQVSMNLTDFTVTPVTTAFEAVADEARARGIQVLESELIGLAPRAAIDERIAAQTRVANWTPGKILENRLRKDLPVFPPLARPI
jgi:glutamate formiminotransferase/glutamate formiminotransferase/formiminotetrahydrofolate cyclodeaminase